MAVPIVLIDRVSVAANAEANVIVGRKGTTLVADSMIGIWLNRAAVGITFSMFVGAEGIMERAGAPVDALAGQTPSFQDDHVVDTFGKQGDLLVLNAINNTAGALEAGFILRITEIDDAVLVKAMQEAALSGITLPGA